MKQKLHLKEILQIRDQDYTEEWEKYNDDKERLDEENKEDKNTKKTD